MSIFDNDDDGLDVLDQSPSESGQALNKKEKAKALAADELTALFRSNHVVADNAVPDWDYLLRNAVSQRQKFEVMATRDLWKANQKEQAFVAQQAAFDKKIDDILSTPQHLRNKQFYDTLAATEPGASFNVRIQKQKQKDRQQMGLGFHLKTR